MPLPTPPSCRSCPSGCSSASRVPWCSPPPLGSRSADPSPQRRRIAMSNVISIKELGHVVLYVRDLERSRAFYRDVLGFREVFAIPSAVAVYSSGRTHHELVLQSVGPDAQPIP